MSRYFNNPQHCEDCGKPYKLQSQEAILGVMPKTRVTPNCKCSESYTVTSTDPNYRQHLKKGAR